MGLIYTGPRANICDWCGKEVKASELTQMWDWQACNECYDSMHDDKQNGDKNETI